MMKTSLPRFLYAAAGAAFLVSFAACSGDPEHIDRPDTGPDPECVTPCGVHCCDADQVCEDGVCKPRCQPQCEAKQCGPDGCGGQCGTCPDGYHCAADGQCARDCEPEKDEELCSRLLKNCGTLIAEDNCGESRTVQCGACEQPRVCDTSTNTCFCPEEPRDSFCARAGVTCGPAQGLDHCGESHFVEECGPCEADFYCDSGSCEPCEAPEAICARFGKNCGQLQVQDACGSRTVSCGECPEGQVCGVNLICSTGGPSNDTCETAELLVFDASGEASAPGTTLGASDDLYGACRLGADDGPDVAYTFTVTEPSRFEATVTPEPDSAVTPVVFLRSACTTNLLGACNHAPAPGAPARVIYARLQPGNYYLFVDSVEDSALTSFLLTARLSAPPPDPPVHDVCAGAETLVIDLEALPATAVADTTYAIDDGGACGGTTLNGPEVIYRFTLADPAAVVVSARRTSESLGYNPAIRLARQCDGADPSDAIACATSSAGLARAVVPVLEAGVYYLAVDGMQGRYGKADLELQVLPPVYHDTCSGAFPLLLDASGTATVQDDTTVALNRLQAGQSSCGTAGRDLVYVFTTEGEKNLEIQLTPPSDAPRRHTLHVRFGSCDDVESEVSCQVAEEDGAPLRYAQVLAPAGTWYVIVDGRTSADYGPFTLSVAAVEPPDPPPHDV